MSKPGARRISSDDCVVIVGGEHFNPHEGEWIEVVPVQTVADLRERIALMQMQVEIEALKGEPDAEAKQMTILDAKFPVICAMLTRVILAWNWTDLQGKPLPNPHNEPDNLERIISTDEMLWLMAATQPEVPAERKNGSQPLPITSLATRSPTTPRSTRVRSHTRP